MSETNTPGEPPEDQADEHAEQHTEHAELGPTQALPSTPSAARRRFAVEIKLVRERVGLTSAGAGAAIERSAATISRIETGKLNPRNIDLAALLTHYRSHNPLVATPEVINRIMSLWAEGRNAQWFDPFRDLTTGAMVPGHVIRLMEYETDAAEVRTYESDVVPGLLQTREYARAIAATFFPSHTREDHDRFAEFRIARQTARYERREPLRLEVVVNEVALRRVIGGSAVHCAQLEMLADVIRGNWPFTTLSVVRGTTAIPATIGGPFVILAFADGSTDGDLVYLETRSGADYLSAEPAVGRYHNYFANLLDVALDSNEALGLIASIVNETSTA